MASRLDRRDFLRVTVVSATALGAFLPACGDDAGAAPPSEKSADQKRVFPQGLASGDPQAASVILWTRVEPDNDGDVSVDYEVATDDAFTKVIAQGTLTADSSSDHTVRLKVDSLDAYTTYYYRFTAQGVRSVVGRTKTAPSATQDVPVRFAFAACQDFVGRYYHAWKALLDEDPVDFVVHLGDYVYETDGDPSFQTAAGARKIVLPDGLVINEEAGTKAAQSLEDYRSLYKQYRSDESLQRVHQLYPFIIIWDDHEFGNDCWQDHTTHFNGHQGLEEVPEQRQAADRAWYEFQPTGAVFHENASFPDDIKVYRTLRYGKHVELFITDQRYYRDAHIIPPTPTNIAVAKIVDYSSVGSRIFLLKSGFDTIEAEAKPSMLGQTQKEWFVDAVKGSNATWKLWGSETQLSQMVADLTDFEKVAEIVRNKFYLSTDQWDGYRSERAEILTALDGVENLVAITGDIHAFYASHLYTDFDKPSDKPVAVEYVVAGITSQAIAPAALSVLDDPAFASFGLLELIPDFDKLLKQGSPHYQFASSFSNGIAVANVSAEKFETTFLIIKDPDVTLEATPDITRKSFQTLSGTSVIEEV